MATKNDLSLSFYFIDLKAHWLIILDKAPRKSPGSKRVVFALKRLFFFSFTAAKVSIKGLHFDLPWNSSLSDRKSEAFKSFRQDLISSVSSNLFPTKGIKKLIEDKNGMYPHDPRPLTRIKLQGLTVKLIPHFIIGISETSLAFLSPWCKNGGR